MVKHCGNCHYFRKLNDPKAFADDEGQCWEPRRGDRDTRNASQSCGDWAAREPERLNMPPSKKTRAHPRAFVPDGGQGHGHLRFRRARVRY